MKLNLLLFLFLPFTLLGQSGDNLFIDCFTFTAQDSTVSAMSLVEIEIKQGRTNFLKTVSDTNGKFQAGLSLGHIYTLSVSKKGYYSKTVVLDLTGIPPEDAEGGFMMELRFSMIEDSNKKDRKLLKKNPIGICSYNKASNAIEFDFEYTKSINSQLHH